MELAYGLWMVPSTVLADAYCVNVFKQADRQLNKQPFTGDIQVPAYSTPA